jgi:prepilin-type processing-associated H-X9-DG protein
MDENLVGYLLNALDPETCRRVEVQLRANPEARRRLALLRQALEPLSADSEEEPPPGLGVRTLAHIARHQRRLAKTVATPPARPVLNLPPAPRSSSLEGGTGRGRWRRADVLIAAALLLAVLSLVAAALPRMWNEYRIYACQNNLRLFHQALAAYSEQHHHAFPKVEEEPPLNVAGIFVPILRDSGTLPANVSLTCPGSDQGPPPSLTVEQLAELRRTRPETFQALAHQLAGCYAYPLGYLSAEALCGLTSDDDARLPIVADAPPDFSNYRDALGNSLNHGGRGQNVLFIDGHAEFLTVRTVGVGGDDIYLNQDGLVAAGRDRFDSVLGASWATPLPPER